MDTDVTSKVLELDGLSFEVLMCGDQNSDNLALFLHGFPEHACTWHKQMKLMADLGYKCWAPNQRGYGKSYSPQDVTPYQISELVSDVVQFVKAADCKTVTIIAHDWGGVIAWNYAIRKAGPLDKFVAMNIPHPVVMAKELTGWRQLKKSWYMLAFQIPFVFEYLFTRNNADDAMRAFFGQLIKKNRYSYEQLIAYRENLLRPGGLKAMLNWYRAAFRYRSVEIEKNKPFYQEKLKVPTLMIWGEEDIALGIHASIGTETYVENLTMRYIPGASHFVQNDAGDDVNNILKAWVTGNHVPGLTNPSVLVE